MGRYYNGDIEGKFGLQFNQVMMQISLVNKEKQGF